MSSNPNLVRRRAAILFADLCGSTQLTARMDPEEAHDLISDCIATLERTARSHGAGLVNYRGDGVLVAFGIPTAHEEITRTAINAALDMRARIREIARSARYSAKPEISIGIASGVVVAGNVSGSDAVELDLTGDPVVVAARLSDEGGPGQILLNEEAHLDVNRDIACRPLGPRSLKGFHEPVAAFEVRATSPVLHRAMPDSRSSISSVVVGRESVRGKLAGVLSALSEEGGGGIVTIRGTAGIGKTRMVQDAQMGSLELPVSWQWGRCLQMSESIPYHPFRDLLCSWAGFRQHGESVDASYLSRALGDLFGDECDDRVATLCSVVGVAVSDEDMERLERYPAEVRELSVHRAFRDWLSALAKRRPTVIVLDDLHWADASSIRLLESVLPLSQQEGLLFLLLIRTDNAERTKWLLDRAAAAGSPADCQFDLQPLGAEDANLLLHNLAGGEYIPPELSREVCARSSGNPFMIEEFVHSLLENEQPESPQGSASRLESWDHQIGLPHSIEEVLLSRFQYLSDEEREALEYGAVLGTEFHASTLAGLVGSETEILERLEGLVSKGLLASRQGANDKEYAFRHPTALQVIYESMSIRRRQQLHARVAATLEAILGNEEESLSARLAYHFSAAGQMQDAEARLIDAGEHAARCGASDEAIAFFGRASELMRATEDAAEKLETEARIERQLAQANFNRGRLGRSERHFNRYLTIRGESVSETPVARSARKVTALLSVAVEVYGPGRSRHREAASPTDVEVLDVMFSRARAETQAGVGDFVSHSLETLAKLRRFDPASVPGAGGMLAGAIGIFTFAGVWPRASSHFLVAGEAAATSGEPTEQMLVRAMRFFHNHFVGDWLDEVRVPEEIIAEAESAGSLWDVVTYLGILGKQCVHQGRFDEAARVIERLGEIEDGYTYLLARQNRLAVAALLAIERGRLAQALGYSRLHQSAVEDVGARVFSLGLHAKVLAQMGSLAAAADVVVEAQETARGISFITPFQISSLNRSEALLAAQIRADSAAHGRNSPLAAFGKFRARRWLGGSRRNPAEHVQIKRLECEWELARNRPSRAASSWRAAAKMAARMGMSPELARLELIAGRRPELASAVDKDRRELMTDTAYPQNPEEWGAARGIDWTPFERTGVPQP